MFFPVSGVDINPFFPPLVAFAVSFFASMGGISGAFLLLPYQISVLGITSPSVSGTNQLFNVVAMPAGIYRFIQEKRMLWPLVKIVVLGTIPGLVVGVFIRILLLPDINSFKVFAGCVLFYVGSRLALNIINQKKGEKNTIKPSTITVLSVTTTKFIFSYSGKRYICSTMGILLFSLIVGVVGGVYGVGGGAIMAPFLIAFFRLPIHAISGATLASSFVTSIGGVILFMVLAPLYPHLAISPDWLLGLLLGVGGLCGIYCGARCQKYIQEKYIRWGLVLVTVGVALGYFYTGLFS